MVVAWVMEYYGYRFATREIIPSGLAGTHTVLKRMSALARAGRRDPHIRRTAMKLTNRLNKRDYNGEIKALHEYVRDRVRYVRDPVDTLGANQSRGIEYISTPRATLETGAGDCDDQSILLSALLGSIGHPSRFTAIATHGRKIPHHVYVETPIDNGRWISAETIHPVALGWEPMNVTNRVIQYAL